jgi:hypothetical protein
VPLRPPGAAQGSAAGAGPPFVTAASSRLLSPVERRILEASFPQESWAAMPAPLPEARSWRWAMSIIRLRAGQACPVCGSAAALPHASLRDCQSASEREPRDAFVQPHINHARRNSKVKRLKERPHKGA